METGTRRSLEAQGAVVDAPHDQRDDGVDVVGRVGQDVTRSTSARANWSCMWRVAAGSSKPWPTRVRDPFEAALDGRQEHDVVGGGEPGRGHERAAGTRPRGRRRRRSRRPGRSVRSTAAAASVTISFWVFDAGSHGSMRPARRWAKKSSPVTRTLGVRAAARCSAAVDFPAPGGPVTMRRSPGIRA